MKKITLSLIAAAALLGGCSAQSSGVGVIGGADGPTAVFVTGGGNPLASAAAAAGIIAVLVLIILLLKKKKK